MKNRHKTLTDGHDTNQFIKYKWIKLTYLVPKIHSSLIRVEKAPYFILNIGIIDDIDRNGNKSQIK